MNEHQKSLNISLWAQLVTTIVLFVYVVGFIVINSYCMNIGIYLFDILNAQYLAAGIATILAFTIYGFMVGRRVVFADNDMSKIIAICENDKYKKVWTVFSCLLVILEIAYGVVVSSFVIVFILFEDVEYLRTTATLLVLVIMFDYLVLISGRYYKKHPFVVLPIAFLIYLCVIVWVGFILRDSRVSSLIWYFAFGTFLLNMLIDIKGKLSQSLPVIVMMSIFGFIGATSYFGKYYYGEIKRELGGGKPLRVIMIVSDDMPLYLKKAFIVDNNATKQLTIMGETNTDILIGLPMDNTNNVATYRINRDLVKAIIPCKKLDISEKKKGS